MHERRLLTRSLGAMRHRQSRRGFDSWAATCTELAERRHSGTVCARRMMNQSTSRAFDSWVDSSRARQALLARLASGLTRWQHQRLAAALARWYNLTLGARDGLRRALWSWRAGSLAAGWRKWRRATFTPPKAAIALGRVRLTARADRWYDRHSRGGPRGTMAVSVPPDIASSTAGASVRLRLARVAVCYTC